ncbi:hypothetical protein ACE1TI_07020 [Alteribacillus sp. JSM 102045]|uniref:oxidoreductase n=1 Tax=Alteribacillus sp. JSM 102045 TaxID=1562101 RepID=UPI0035C0933F
MEPTHIFSPITLRDTEFKSRLFVDSIHEEVTGKEIKEQIVFDLKKAKNHVGLIISGRALVISNEKYGKGFLSVAADEDIDDLKHLTEAVHEEGGKIALQLFDIGETLVHPSVHTKTPKRMPEKEIYLMIEAFAKGANRAKQAGCDAVEILGSNGYLINQFLSPLTNKRKDKWGRTFENRMHFSLGVARHVREYVGEHFPVLYRIPALFLEEDSTTEEQILHLAKQLDFSGIDLLNIGVGWYETMSDSNSLKASEDAFLSAAERIKKHVSIPIGITKPLNNFDRADQLVKNETADMIAVLPETSP